MRTISVVNNKLVISANDNTSYDSTLHKEASAYLDNITIDDNIIRTTVVSGDGVVITSVNGEIDVIKLYNDGVMVLGTHSIARRVKLSLDRSSAVVFDQSFIDWYESVKAVPVAQ